MRPDFIPFLGYADDLIIAALTLRPSPDTPVSTLSNVTGPEPPKAATLSPA